MHTISIKNYMKMFSKAICLFLCMSLVLLCACSANQNAIDVDAALDSQESLVPAITTPGVMDAQLNLSMPMDTAVINPYEITSYKMQSLVPLIFETPITLDVNGSPKPYLCSGYTINEDASVNFTIRENITFHDGSLFDASYIANAIELAKQSQSYSYVSAYIDSYTVSEDKENISIVPKKGAYNLIVHMDFPIIGTNGTIGTGPYKIDDMRTGSGISLSVNESWWMKQPEIKNIYVKAMDDDAQIPSLLAGEIDAIYARGRDISAYLSSGKYRSITLATPSYEYIVFNMNSDLMSNKDLRFGIVNSLDRRTMISNAYFGTITLSDEPVYAGSWLSGASSSLLEQDMKAAVEHIAKSGFTDNDLDGFFDNGIPIEDNGSASATPSPGATPEPIKYESLTVRILTNTDTQSSSHKEAANMIATQIEQLGFKSEIKMVEIADLEDELEEGNFDIAVLATYLGNSVDLYDLYHTNGKLNYSKYSSSAVDSMIERHINAVDEAEYADTAAKILEMISQDMPIIGIGFKNAAMLYSNELDGIGAVDSYNIYRNIDSWSVETDEQH